MIIGIDASRANEEQKTGTEWYAYHLIEEFKKIFDSSITVILYSKEPLKGSLADLPKNFKNRVLRWPPRFLWTQFRLSFEMLFHAPDLLFVPSHTIPIFHPKKTVVTLHDIGFEKFHSLYSKEMIGYRWSLMKRLIGFGVKLFTGGRYANNELDYHRWAARYAMKHAWHIITVSQFSKKEIEHVFGRKKEISVIYNGFDAKRYSPPSSQTDEHSQRSLAGLGIQQPYFLSIGRKEIKKNTLGLIQAFEIFLESIHDEKKPLLVLIGKEGTGYAHVRSWIQKHHLQSHVIEPGWVREEDIPTLFRKAMIFLFPSFYEGFGIPLLEAMASGTPIIAAQSSSIPEVVERAGLYCDPYKPETIAMAMKTLWENPKERSLLIGKGFARIQKFSWAECARKTKHLLLLME